MPQNKDDNLFNNPDPRSEKKNSSPLTGLFNKLKSKGAELKKAGRDFQADKIAIADYKTGLNANQSERSDTPIIETTNTPENTSPQRDNQSIRPAGQDIKAEIKEKVVVSAKKWRAPKILKTNLIKGEVTTFIDWKRNFLVLSLSFLLSTLIIAVIYVGLVFWEIKEIEKAQALDNELRILSQSIIKTEEEIKPVNIFEAKLALAQTLLDKHISWIKYIDFLEKNLLKDVVLTSAISADIKGEYSLSLQGRSYADIEEQIKVFKNNDMVKDVWVKSGKIADASKEELLINRGVNFNLDFTLVDDFFRE